MNNLLPAIEEFDSNFLEDFIIQQTSEKSGRYNIRNIVTITIKMRTLVQIDHCIVMIIHHINNLDSNKHFLPKFTKRNKIKQKRVRKRKS